MAKPVKTSDGSYFLPLRSTRVQLNNVQLDSSWMVIGLNDDQIGKIADIDVSIVNQAKENCVDWFGKKLSNDFLENVYDSAIEGNALVARIAKSADGSIQTRFFNEAKEPVQPSDITGPYDIIVELHGIQFIRKGYNPVWRILQVRERPKVKPEIPEEYMFQDE